MRTGKLSKHLALALVMSVTFGLLGVASADAQEARIAAVNSDRILRESAAAKAAQTKLELEFSKRDKALQDMAARLKTM